MSRLRHGFAHRLFAALLVMQLALGLAVCRAGYAGSPAAGEEASLAEARSPEPQEGTSSHDRHAGGGHHECPETFLASAAGDLSPLSAHGRLPPAVPQDWRSAACDVPAPIPIA